MEMWMYWITAIVFTVLGWYWGVKYSREAIVKLTIDSLIRDGYVRVRGFGDDQELVKLNDD